MAMDHAEFNLDLGTPAEFVLLNPVGGYHNLESDEMEEGLDFVMVDSKLGSKEEQLKKLEDMLSRTRPGGGTPLTARCRKIRNQIMPKARDLALQDQKIILILVTDGVPTDQYGRCDRYNFTDELKRISGEIPSHIVIRLCTDEDNVTEFYNEIDRHVELELEIIDDMRGEAQEIRANGNGWFTYGPMLHRIREAGTFLKILDLVDERRLNPMEVALFAQLILRQDEDDQPLPADPYEFCIAMRKLLPKVPETFDPIYQRSMPALNADGVEWAVLPMSDLQRSCGNVCEGSCSLM